MDRLTSALSLLLLVAVSVTHAAATAPQLAYWHSVLPNTPIPSALVDLLNFDVDSCHMGNLKDRNQLFARRYQSATEKPSVAAMNLKDRNQLFVRRSHGATEKPSVSAINLKDRNQLFVRRSHGATEKPSVSAMNLKDCNQLFVRRSHGATEKPSVSAMNLKDRNQLFVIEMPSVSAMNLKDRNQLFVTEKPSVSAMNLKDRNQLFVRRSHGATEKPSVSAMNLKDRNRLFVRRSHGATEKPSVSAMNLKDGNQLFVQRSHGATENHIPVDHPNVSLFFLKDDLRIGAEIKLPFTKTTTSEAVGFLPREQADSIPFSSARLTEILNYFSVEPGSPEANAMAETLNDCDVSTTAEGEKKYCATSLESMVEFCVSTLGGVTNNIKAVSTNVPKSWTPIQKYTVTETKPTGDEVVPCHRLTYLYPVFGCHALPASSSYAMTLVGVDGSTVESMALCHANTSAWDPNHIAFKVLQVKPGATVCHVMPEQDIVWSRSRG